MITVSIGQAAHIVTGKLKGIALLQVESGILLSGELLFNLSEVRYAGHKQAGPQEKADCPILGTDHRSGKNNQKAVKQIAGYIGIARRKKVQNQEYDSSTQRYQAECANDPQGGAIVRL